MNYSELKEKALKLARIFFETNELQINTNEDLSPAEWYLYVTLAQIYYNHIIGLITKTEALHQQQEAFEYVKINAKLFY